MAVDIEGLRLLALAQATGADFRRTVTIGRQNYAVAPAELKGLFQGLARRQVADDVLGAPADAYCDSLLKRAFGAETIDSVDASGYEAATIVHDMNQPIQGAGTYGVVGDFGTLEHIFNLPVALDNVAALCAPGGHILHVLPCNNHVGHGFYQFSPELFFRVYAEGRGFTGTRVFLAPARSTGHWYEVSDPEALGRRVNITSRDQLMMLVITKRTGTPASLVTTSVQQSDYALRWSDSDEPKPSAPGGFEPPGKRLRKAFGGVIHAHKMRRKDVTRGSRKDIRRRDVLELIRQP